MEDWIVLMGAGGLFIVLGLAAVIWDRAESKGYYNSIATRHDVREYLQHDPERPEFGALKKGGWISILIGLALIILGVIFLFR
jgi:hypothetical protein